MMDVIDAGNNQLGFLHISGDLLFMDMKTLQITEAFHPREPVVGRKLDADSHMLMRSGSNIFVGHLEGIIDRATTPK
jgi:hypothetical protein